MLEISITIDDKELCSPSADGAILATLLAQQPIHYQLEDLLLIRD